MMYQFQIHVHPRPTGAVEGEAIPVGAQTVATLKIDGGPGRFHATFERACEILETLPRMFIEPDGSFVWTGLRDEQAWQVDGVLYDEGPSLSYVEMSGCCPANEFDQFLAALGWPAAPVMFQLAQQGVFVDEQDFRRLASSQLAT